jgi:AraC family transcriptional activator of pyochelin receptor
MPSADGNGALSEGDAQRILSARRMIDEHWHEKLTIDMIGRACGLNRAKLTKGFRAIFDCSIGDAIVERRLSNARHMLLVTDLPIASIGYRCGYHNNASFTRAFSKKFGMVPTRLRGRTAV